MLLFFFKERFSQYISIACGHSKAYVIYRLAWSENTCKQQNYTCLVPPLCRVHLLDTCDANAGIYVCNCFFITRKCGPQHSTAIGKCRSHTLWGHRKFAWRVSITHTVKTQEVCSESIDHKHCKDTGSLLGKYRSHTLWRHRQFAWKVSITNTVKTKKFAWKVSITHTVKTQEVW